MGTNVSEGITRTEVVATLDAALAVYQDAEEALKNLATVLALLYDDVRPETLPQRIHEQNINLAVLVNRIEEHGFATSWAQEI